MRITGQLIDAATGAHLWADRFDGALEDIFDLQDQVSACVLAVGGYVIAYLGHDLDSAALPILPVRCSSTRETVR